MIWTKEQAPGISIVYDGECPVCNQFVRMTRLREAVGKVALHDARQSNDPLIKTLQQAGFDLNEGMVVIYQGHTAYGAQAVQTLYALSTGSTIFNRIGAWWFRSSVRAETSYQVLRFGRFVLLSILGRGRIDP